MKPEIVFKEIRKDHNTAKEITLLTIKSGQMVMKKNVLFFLKVSALSLSSSFNHFTSKGKTSAGINHIPTTLTT